MIRRVMGWTPVATLAALSALSLGALTGCAAVDDSAETFEPTGSRDDARAEPIVNGGTAANYPEAVHINMPNNLVCSGAVIAPTVVLTAGHCISQHAAWHVVAPYVNQDSNVVRAEVFDYTETSPNINPGMHDVGVLILQDPITINSYPSIAPQASADGTEVYAVGRKRNGIDSLTDLYRSVAVPVTSGFQVGHPRAYVASRVTEAGDSGGPILLTLAPGPHTIVGVVSGATQTQSIFARTDLVHSWLMQKIAENEVVTPPPTPTDPPPADPPPADPPPTEPPSKPADSGCGGVTFEGECQADGSVIWCDNDQLYTIDCGAHGEVCSMDPKSGLYDCK